MATSNNGVVTFRPFTYGADGLPAGMFRGSEVNTGDGSGGNNAIIFALEPGLAYQVRAVSARVDDTTVRPLLFSIDTGITFPAQSHVLTHQVDRGQVAATVGGLTFNQGVTWEPPRLVFLPDEGTSPTVRVDMDNVNAIQMSLTIYGLYFDPAAVRRQPLLGLALFL